MGETRSRPAGEAAAFPAEFPATRPIAVLLSGDGKPYADLEAAERREAGG